MTSAMLTFFRFFIAQTIAAVVQPTGIEVVVVEEMPNEAYDEFEDLLEEADEEDFSEEEEKVEQRVDGFFMIFTLLVCALINHYIIPNMLLYV